MTETPKKQSSGQILDKFGVRGIFECCKGPEGSHTFCALSFPDIRGGGGLQVVRSLTVNSPALILSKDSGVSLAKIG